jgi:hypothetical protein
MTDRVIVFLPDGRPLALGEAEFRAALAAGEAFAAPAQPPVAGQGSAPERLLDSRQLGELLGVGDTWLEGAAKRGDIPSVRIGKALRFEPAAVLAVLRAGHAVNRTAPHVQVTERVERKPANNRKTTPYKHARHTPNTEATEA